MEKTAQTESSKKKNKTFPFNKISKTIQNDQNIEISRDSGEYIRDVRSNKRSSLSTAFIQINSSVELSLKN